MSTKEKADIFSPMMYYLFNNTYILMKIHQYLINLKQPSSSHQLNYPEMMKA